MNRLIRLGLPALAGALTISIPDAFPAAPSTRVRINQHGYAPAETKWVAVALASGTPAIFEIRRRNDDSLVLSGALTLRRSADPGSGDNVYQGLFSSLAAIGEYVVRVPGVGDSHPFQVHGAVYDDLYRKLLKGLYYQRCGTAIDVAHGGDWTHEACHDEAGGMASYDWATTGGAPGGYRNTIGGWHDAGDYGKYSTNNAYAVGVLLQAYDHFPSRYPHDDAGIPESGNGVPDLLDEARWSLQWMQKMQLANGSVLHRESVASYAGEFLPEAEPTTRYYTSISSDATAVHCAAMALAARVYAGVDPTFAATCSTSAVNAWNWLQSNPGRVPVAGFANQFGHTGATYIAGNELGRRLWAAAELYRLNGSAAAKSWFDARWGDGLTFNGVWYPDGWGDLANMGAFAYRDAPGATAGIKSGNWWSIENSTLSSVGGWNTRVGQDGYGCVASTTPPSGDYYWGFTGVLLRYAWTMIQADRYTPNSAWVQSAREQLHYILGRNPVDQVYVTGLGERPVLHSHGAWNLAAGYVNVDDALCRPIPNLLVGGANKADNSAISPYPGKCYEDIADPNYFNKGNYTLNETAVNIQASLIVLAGYFSSGNTVSGVDDPDIEPAPAARVATISASPNPFVEGTTLTLASGAPLSGDVMILDAAGRRVARLAVRAIPGAKSMEVRWDGLGTDGQPVAPGVYWARVAGQGESRARQLVRIRR
ncbi:MAG: glycoside hydrolase family 9 protein [Candidatus Eisenbacteria bacterium]|nr:glycoside hydrolase family 9 protein [Candidatus Eisenbacteria bacterium]